MRVEPKMGLRIWNTLEDPYDHEQLADNWAKVGSHDHTEGRGVKIPTGGIVSKAITSALIANGAVGPEQLATAVREKLQMEFKVREVNLTAEAGEFVEAKKGITVGLPTPTTNRRVGVFNATASETVTVKQNGTDKIYGAFTTGSNEVKLLAFQWVVLQSDGTNWLVVAGEPKREQSYGARTQVASNVTSYEVIPNATRPTIVAIDLVKTSELLTPEIKVGGVKISENLPSNEENFFSVYVPAGQVLKIIDRGITSGKFNAFTSILVL